MKDIFKDLPEIAAQVNREYALEVYRQRAMDYMLAIAEEEMESAQFIELVFRLRREYPDISFERWR